MPNATGVRTGLGRFYTRVQSKLHRYLVGPNIDSYADSI